MAWLPVLLLKYPKRVLVSPLNVNVVNYIVNDFKTILYKTKCTWEVNGKFTFLISDEINVNLFLFGEAKSIRRMVRDRPKLAESVRVCACMCA